MSQVKSLRARRIAQSVTKAFKSNKFEVGTVLSIGSYEEADTKGDNSVHVDFLLCTDNASGKTLKLPVREFNKMLLSEGAELVRSLEGGEELYPKSITIEASEDRMGRDADGNDAPFYPAYAYKNSKEFYDSLATATPMTWAELLAGGEKDEHNFDLVQNYTVSTKF